MPSDDCATPFTHAYTLGQRLRNAEVRIVLRALAALPLPWAHRLGRLIGWWLVLCPNRMRDVTHTNIALCLPGLEARARRRIERGSLIELGKTIAELGALWCWPPARVLALVKDVCGEDAVQQAYRQGRGLILVAPHLGAWELSGLYCAQHYALTTLYRTPRRVELDGLLRRARERTGARLVSAGTIGVRALFQALRRGTAVGLLPDQEPRAGAGAFAPFFGVPAYTAVLPARLTAESKAPVFFVYAERLRHGSGYRLHFLPTPHDLAAQPLTTALAGLNGLIESCVLRCIDQYQWSYKRFRTQPAGQRNPYHG